MIKEHNDYLIALRNSGIVNMLRAGPYLQTYFGIDRKEAKTILIEWINSFAQNRGLPGTLTPGWDRSAKHEQQV